MSNVVVIFKGVIFIKIVYNDVGINVDMICQLQISALGDGYPLPILRYFLPLLLILPCTGSSEP